MPRIISGRAGSLTLEVPASGTRPTSDRVRESLFSALESSDSIRDAAVLDLFAGSGALGLESASRGAAAVTLVERSAAAAAIAKRNAAKVARALGGSPAAKVKATSFFSNETATTETYDLGDDELREALTLLVPRLSAHATVIIERAGRSAEPPLPDGLEHLRNKKYGDTTLWWVVPASPEGVDDTTAR